MVKTGGVLQRQMQDLFEPQREYAQRAHEDNWSGRILPVSTEDDIIKDMMDEESLEKDLI